MENLENNVVEVAAEVAQEAVKKPLNWKVIGFIAGGVTLLVGGGVAAYYGFKTIKAKKVAKIASVTEADNGPVEE